MRGHAGIDVECLDLNVNFLSTDQLLRKIITDDFHIVGIGGFATQLKSTIDISNIIKRGCPDTCIIVGGVQVYGCDDFILNNSKIDIVCIGESELILPELIHRIYQGKDLSKIPSIKYRHNNIITDNGGFSIIQDIDELYFPKYDAFNMDKYIKSNYHSDTGKENYRFYLLKRLSL